MEILLFFSILSSETGALFLIFHLILFYIISEVKNSFAYSNVKIVLLVLWILNYIVLFYMLYKIIYYCKILFLPVLILNFICSISTLSEITEYNKEFDIFNMVSTIITTAIAIIVVIGFRYYIS